jgi:hypothetical protein
MPGPIERLPSPNALNGNLTTATLATSSTPTQVQTQHKDLLEESREFQTNVKDHDCAPFHGLKPGGDLETQPQRTHSTSSINDRPPNSPNQKNEVKQPYRDNEFSGGSSDQLPNLHDVGPHIGKKPRGSNMASNRRDSNSSAGTHGFEEEEEGTASYVREPLRREV